MEYIGHYTWHRIYEKLNTYVTEYYDKKNKNPISIVAPKYIVSSSMETGEGEHKIFEYIRKYPECHNSPDTTTLIYGLDADLIMLTLNHLHITNNKNMYLLETLRSLSNLSTRHLMRIVIIYWIYLS